MRAVVLLLVLLVAFSAADLRKKRDKNRIQAQNLASLRSFLSYDYNYDFAKTISREAKSSGVSGCDTFDVTPYLAVRTNKFEASMSLAVQNNPAMIAVLKEMLHRELCVAKVAFPDNAAAGIDENFRREHLFALPGNVQSQAEAQWVATFTNFPPFDSWTKSWINLDNSRSGMWVTNDLGKNLAYLQTLLTSGNTWRELLHTLTRASLYGEDISDRSRLKYHAPYSLRHAIYVILSDTTGALLTQAKSQCGFQVVDKKKDLVHKKSYFGSYKDTAVDKARLKDKPFRGMSDKSNKQAESNPYYAYRMTVNPKAVGCDAFPTKLTPNALATLNMPPISDREYYYFKKFYHMKPDDKPGVMKWVPITGDDPVPWGYGACVWSMDSNKFTWNKEWVDAMNEDGLAIDAGPSGTTDEILSVGDWMGLTSNAFSFCALRDVAIALMPVAEHHSLGEIIQGAYDGVRAKDAGLTDFEFADPWKTILWCDAAQNNFVTKFVTTNGANKLPDSISRFQTALTITETPTNQLPWTVVQSATDYASEPVPHKFRDDDIATPPGKDHADWTKFCSCVSGTIPPSAHQFEKKHCRLASISRALGCPNYSRSNMAASQQCVAGTGVGAWGTSANIAFSAKTWNPPAPTFSL